MDESKIPKGPYCYDENGICPYWGLDESKPKQEQGFCTFLDIRDWEDTEGVPLLWDMIKECRINECWEECFGPMDDIL